MTDSSMYSSLFALVDSHLSKTSIQENGGDTNTTSPNISLQQGLPGCSASESLLPLYTQPKLSIPSLSSNGSSIQTILAQQVANMLKAKEKQKEEEILKQKLKENTEDDSVIDLIKAVQVGYCPEPRSNMPEVVNNLVDSIVNLKLLDNDNDKEPEEIKTPEKLLPCVQDMSYILNEKIKMGKCSTFGKVLSRRWIPKPAPYFRERIPTSIVRFNFNTPSPCDIIKANLRKPTMSCTYTLDITKFV